MLLFAHLPPARARAEDIREVVAAAVAAAVPIAVAVLRMIAARSFVFHNSKFLKGILCAPHSYC